MTCNLSQFDIQHIILIHTSLIDYSSSSFVRHHHHHFSSVKYILVSVTKKSERTCTPSIFGMSCFSKNIISKNNTNNSEGLMKTSLRPKSFRSCQLFLASYLKLSRLQFAIFTQNSSIIILLL